MKKFILTLVLVAAKSFSQRNEKFLIGAGFAHFDDTNGFEANYK